jgi:hypothetical protein
MILTLDVRRARKGDCMLLHFGSKQAPGLIVVDGGPKAVYGPHLKPRLAEIRKARKLGGQDSLPIDLLMVSHVDDDHIQGILDMTKELIEAQDAHKSLPVRIMGLWHNSFDDIIRGRETRRLPGAVGAQFGAAALNGDLPEDATVDADDPALSETDITANLKVLASIPQGFRLRDDAKKLGVELNPELAGELIVAEPGAAPIEIAGGALRLTIAGPLQPELDKLRQKHEAWLTELQKQSKTPANALAAYVDRSVPNLSSIVVLVEADGRSVLLTGDARGDKILQGMETAGVLPVGGKRHVNILKAPHHGSSNNLDDDFFERLTANHYVFSGNGEHGNPERETLEMLLKARGEQDDYTVHLTYPIDEIDKARQADWNKERKKELAKKQKNSNRPVRPVWSADSHSLSALFDTHPKFEAKVKIVDKAKSHLIDLGEPLGETWPDLGRR